MKKLLGKGGGNYEATFKSLFNKYGCTEQLLKLLTRCGLYSKLGYFISLVFILLQSGQYILELIIEFNNVPVNKYIFDTKHASLHQLKIIELSIYLTSSKY